jgi:hypothetical protein
MRALSLWRRSIGPELFAFLWGVNGVGIRVDIQSKRGIRYGVCEFEGKTVFSRPLALEPAER